jgi:glycosyltransferase involved in cell wall biosynthesis
VGPGGARPVVGGELPRPSPVRGSPLRVVYLDHTAQLSGGELALLRLLPALTSVDAQVVLASDGPLVGRLRQAGVTVDILPMAVDAVAVHRSQVQGRAFPALAAAKSGAYVLHLAHYLRQHKPDLVHTNSLKAALYGAPAARLAGVPVVWHIRDRISPDYLPAPAVRLVRGLARWLPNGVIANSASTLATLPPLSRAWVVPSPVSPKLWDLPRQSPGPGGPLRVGVVGRIAPWKAQHVAVEALVEAFPAGGATLVIAGAAMFGEDDYEQQLRRAVARSGVADRVDVVGFADPIDQVLTRLDVLVHTSIVPEPFGQVVVEGMAAGLAVVAAGAGGPAEIIDSGRNGLLYPPGDATSLAGHLTRLAADPELRARLGAQARIDAVRFRPDTVAAAIAEVYGSVLADRRHQIHQ